MKHPKSARHCRDCWLVMSKHVQGSARQCKAVQDTASFWRSGKSFLVSFGGVVQLIRTLPVTQDVAGSRPVAPANFTICQAANTARWARWPDQSIQARLLLLIRRN